MVAMNLPRICLMLMKKGVSLQKSLAYLPTSSAIKPLWQHFVRRKRKLRGLIKQRKSWESRGTRRPCPHC